MSDTIRDRAPRPLDKAGDGGPGDPDRRVGASPHAPARPRWQVITAALILLLGMVGTVWWALDRPDDIRAGSTAVDAQGMAARYGIDVNLLAVTAAGGMIQLRYQVVDPDKADRVVHEPSLAPVLIIEETGETIIMNSPPHHHGSEMELGGTYFFLMANANNAIHQGTLVTLLIGDARLEHITAQG